MELNYEPYLRLAVATLDYGTEELKGLIYAEPFRVEEVSGVCSYFKDVLLSQE
jgi:hypothetical protein